jgi:hypothetical protein
MSFDAPPARSRWLLFSLFTLAVCGSVVAYVAFRYGQHSESIQESDAVSSNAPNSAAAPSVAQLRRGPHVFTRSAKRAEFGRVVVESLDPAVPGRAVTELTCERFALAADRGICVQDNRINVMPPAKALIVGPSLELLHTVDLAGLPSRARISSDGRVAVATVFATGDDYESEFSTRTTLLDTHSGQPIADLEQFAVYRKGQLLREVDFNFWGVSFKRNSNEFYATLATKGKTHLVSGDIAARRLELVRENVECPSLSADESTLVFKSRTEGALGWRLHALDLNTGQEWPLESETRSVDDQVEWLDSKHVLYRILDDRGLPEQALNVWSSPVTRGAMEAPLLFRRGSSSPSVQR